MEGMFICYVRKNMAGQIKSQCFDSDGECFFKTFSQERLNVRFWSLNRNPDCRISVECFLMTAVSVLRI